MPERQQLPTLLTGFMIYRMVKSVMMELILIILKDDLRRSLGIVLQDTNLLQARLWTISDMEDSMQLMKNV